MFRAAIIAVGIATLIPSIALAWGKSNYYSYSEGQSASYASRGSDATRD